MNRNDKNIPLSRDSTIRISTKEIDDAIQQLESAYTDGRLDENELGERMALALKAKTESDLAHLLRDLTRTANLAQPIVVDHKLRRLKNAAVAIFSGIELNGQFILPKEYRISAIMGGCLIDLSRARLESPYSTIHITAIMGGVQIFVPKGIRIEIDGFPIMGGISKHVADEDLPHDAPVIHLHCKAIMGGIEIITKDGSF